ncbi:hypothetical protein SELMODRAFT_423460 [Selaginella moellendorffii]|uniref:Bidirectional sugar transporter SWEET n=1 Tax=Selaginella moellendorffii TaxID=88036 RepID=D8SLS6_SELML|nr:hypothetical protein SELMODRAFT_423460 [Selaginella moellendorffii]
MVRNNNKRETSQMASSHSTTKRLFHGKAAAFPTLLIDEANRFHEWSLCPKEQHHLRNLQDYFLMLTKETNTANVILCSSEDIRRVAGTCEQASWRLEKEAFLSSVLFDVETMSQASFQRRHSTAWCNTSSSQLLVSGLDVVQRPISSVTISKIVKVYLALTSYRSAPKMSTCSWESLVEENQGNVTAMVMFLSPTPTFWRIINSRDTGSFSPVPYACTLLNCLLWFFYGLPAVTSNNTLIVTINAAGIILECIYLIVFFTFAPAAHRGYLSVLLVGVAGFFAAAIAVTLTAFQQEQRAKFVGAVCVVVGTLMYASPLSVMKLVIATRSVEYMPFSLSLCSLINALLWTIYGVLKHDKFLIVS